VVSPSSIQESISQYNCFLKSWSMCVIFCTNRSLLNSELSQWTDMQRLPWNVMHMHSTIYWATVQHATPFCHKTVPFRCSSHCIIHQKNWCCLVWLHLIKLKLNTVYDFNSTNDKMQSTLTTSSLQMKRNRAEQSCSTNVYTQTWLDQAGKQLGVITLH
jgi:hypothetical protein